MPPHSWQFQKVHISHNCLNCNITIPFYTVPTDNKKIATLIRKNSLQPGEEYIVKLKAEAVDGLRKGFTSKRFIINEGPYGGRCQALVPRGENTYRRCKHECYE